MELSPLSYNLPKRTLLQHLGPNHIGIVKKIKSRIIQKDALKITDMTDQIRTINPQLKISLICHPNICSKSLQLLNNKGIDVVICPD